MLKTPLFVVPVDFSPEMEATVAAAFALAKGCGAHVDLLEVVPTRGPSMLDDKGPTGLGDRVTSSRDWSRLETRIELAKREGIPVPAAAYRGDTNRIISLVRPAHEGKTARHWSTLRNVWLAAERTNRQQPNQGCACARADSPSRTSLKEQQIAAV